ncbi:hypothetical protein BN946_scf184994.g60 [Trametes cinnabarina]|uniref:HMG box domain-containing protein n=1 Tax=Pycnoporus cinnabarinus TaxID=5643 RepID=A0A060SEC5_PYCCI|nr:hypothetical protein BN946_scf184994.g60 [Trametes cinnabarina]
MAPIRTRPEDQPPRPPNAWMLYRADKSKELTQGRPAGMVLLQAEISRILGQRWALETPSVRDFYEQKAKEAKEAHERMYPDYQYIPVPKVEKQKRRAEVKAAKERARAEIKAAKASARRSARSSLRTTPEAESSGSSRVRFALAGSDHTPSTYSRGSPYAVPAPFDILRRPSTPCARYPTPYSTANAQYPLPFPHLMATSYHDWSRAHWYSYCAQVPQSAPAHSPLIDDRVRSSVGGTHYRQPHCAINAAQLNAAFNASMTSITLNLEDMQLEDTPLRQNVTVDEMMARAAAQVPAAKGPCPQGSQGGVPPSFQSSALDGPGSALSAGDSDPEGMSTEGESEFLRSAVSDALLRTVSGSNDHPEETMIASH